MRAAPERLVFDCLNCGRVILELDRLQGFAPARYAAPEPERIPSVAAAAPTLVFFSEVRVTL